MLPVNVYAAADTLIDVTSGKLSPGAIIQQQTTPSLQKPPLPLLPDQEPVDIEYNKKTPKLQGSLNTIDCLFIKDIKLEGATLLPPELVEGELSKYRNRNLTFADVEKLTQTLTQAYRTRGYITSQVYIPIQDFSNGTITLKALESRIGEVIIERGHYFGRRAIKSRLKFGSDDILNLNPIEFSVRNINENPDLKLRIQLKSGAKPGQTNVVIKMVDQHPIHLTPFWDNLGRNTIGNNRFGALVTHNNLLGFGDQAVSGFNIAERNVGVTSQYDLPVGAYGTRIGFRHAYNTLKIGGALSALDIQSQANIYSLQLTQPWLKRPRVDLSSDIAMDFKELNTTVANTPFNTDQLRVIRPGTNLRLIDKWGQTQLRQELAVGLPLLGGNLNDDSKNSKSGSGSQFFQYNTYSQRTQLLPFGIIGLLRVNSQLSGNRLTAAQQMQLGGAYTVRGYQEGRFIADKGIFVSNEYYIPSLFFPKKWTVPFIKRPWREALYWVGFADFGTLATNDAIPGELSHVTLGSAGVGLRLQFSRTLVGRVDLGFPLIQHKNDTNNPRVHFGLQTTLF